MTPKDNDKQLLIPYTIPVEHLPARQGSLQLRVHGERRRAALLELRQASLLPRIASEMAPGKLYQLVLPDGQLLQKGSNGLYSGVVYKQGRIAQHAGFQRAFPNITRIATAVGAQIMLVSIAMQLNQIEQAIARISAELHHDRVGKMLGGVAQFESAFEIHDSRLRDHALLNAIQTLSESLEPITRELRSRVERMPDSHSNFWDNWGWWRRCDEAQGAYPLLAEAFEASILCAQTLAQCYAALSEPAAGERVLADALDRIARSGVDTAAERARLVPFDSNQTSPEAAWLQFAEMHRAYREGKCRPFHGGHAAAPERMAIEITKDDLEEESA